MPSTVARLLAEGAGGDYGVHSEMFTTGLMHLHQAGKIDEPQGPVRRRLDLHLRAGTAELYEWLDGNDEVAFPARSTS